MRKWLCLGIVTVAASCLGGYWLCSKPAPNGRMTIRPHSMKSEKHDGDAETSDTIEPLVVDQGGGSVTFRPIPLANDEMMPRVAFSPGMSQPPRPDARHGHTPRMPYADEETILAVPLDPVTRILESSQPLFKLFEGIEFEPAEPEPEAQHPPCDYHRMQPHCPFPYYRR